MKIIQKIDELWVDLAYELRGYLENWLETLEIKDFEALKQLVLTEQLKKRISVEVKEHFIDNWETINQASALAEKCDRFDFVRRENRKWEPSSFKKTHSFRQRLMLVNGGKVKSRI